MNNDKFRVWIETNALKNTEMIDRKEKEQLIHDLHFGKYEENCIILENDSNVNVKMHTVMQLNGIGNFKPHVHTEIHVHDVILPNVITETYARFDDTTEFYFKGWTFMCIQDIKDRRFEFERQSQHKTTPFAFQRQNMHQYYVLAYSSSSNICFTYIDVGVSLSEQQEKFQKLCTCLHLILN